MRRSKFNNDNVEAIKEYLKRYRTKNEQKYKKAERERKQYERERIKYLEPKKYVKHLQRERNLIRPYRQKKEAEKTQTRTEKNK